MLITSLKTKDLGDMGIKKRDEEMFNDYYNFYHL
jgi:hypothetical protein